MSNSEKKYDVFISHAGEDTDWCEQLANRLRDAGLIVWFDKWQMPTAGIDLIEAMEKGLAQSRRAILVLTPEYLNEDKTWAPAERRFITCQQLTGRREFAIPLLLKHCILPPFLRSLKYLDFLDPAAYEVNLQQLIAMLQGATRDDTISTVSEISDIIPALGQLPPNSYLPYEWNPHFVGRDAELKQLHRLLNRGKNIVAVNQVGDKVAMTGLGGYGKTQLAIEYAFRYGRFYSGGVYWLSATRLEEIQSSVAVLSVPMGLNLPTDIAVNDRAFRVLTELRRPIPRLLILDNIEDPEVLVQANVAGGGCRVLITTRRADLARVKKFEIDVLNKEASIALLSSRRRDLQEALADSEQKTAEKICARLGNLPLALELAAFYLGRHKNLSFFDYWKELEGGVLNHTSQNKIDFKKLQSPTGYKHGVAESFQLSFRELTDSPEAKRLFFAACYFSPESINPNLLGKVANLNLRTNDGIEALNLLLDLSLFKQLEDSRLQMHRLLMEFGQQTMSEQEATDLLVQLITIMLEFINSSTDDVYRLNEVQPELPHLIRTAELTISLKAWPQAVMLCGHIGSYFSHRSQYKTSLQWHQQALQIYETKQPVDEKGLASTLNNIGGVLAELGEWNESITHYHSALAIWKKLFGEDQPNIAVSLSNIGLVNQGLENSTEWLKYFRQGFEASDRIGKEDHRRVALLLSNIGLTLRKQDRYSEALNYYQQALEILKNLYGNENPELASILNNIGMLLWEYKDFVGALNYLNQAEKILKQVYGENHLLLAMVSDNVAKILREQGNLSEALARHQQVLNIRKNIFGEDHPEVGSSLNEIGMVLKAQGKVAEALEQYRQSIAIKKNTLGDKHPELAVSLFNMAEALKSQGNFSEALVHYRQALDIFTKAFGEEHSRVARVYGSIGHVLHAQGNLPNALVYFRFALKIFQKIFGKEHSDVAGMLTSIGVIYFKQNNIGKAVEYFSLSLPILQKVFGPEHVDTKAILEFLNLLEKGRVKVEARKSKKSKLKRRSDPRSRL